MKLIPNAVTTKYARQVLLGRKNSPTILFGMGVAGMVGSTLLACRATLKLEEVLNTANYNLSIANSLEHDDYSEMDRKKDISIIYVQSAVKIGTLYAPSLLLGAFSISALTASHNILTQRNVALTAAYAALDKGFSEYRARVIEKYGEDQDRKFRYETEIVEVVDEKGKKSKATRVAPGAESIYARFFDQFSASWSKEPEYNLLFLRAQQNYSNDLLKSRGHLFLNEVYTMLGIEHSSAGAVVGWVIGEEGDNFVDFGIFDDKQGCRDFVNGREGSILLDFNVDGVIYDKIKPHKRGAVAWQS